MATSPRPDNKTKAPRNRTLEVTEREKVTLRRQLMTEKDYGSTTELFNRIVNDSFENLMPYIPDHSIDLLVLDPPYNLNKAFRSLKFSKTSVNDYSSYLTGVFEQFLPKLKKHATIYICGDWFSSVSIFSAASKFFHVRNRITWEREKGRRGVCPQTIDRRMGLYRDCRR